MRRAVIAAVLTLTVPVALAQVYRWVDEKGRVHYGEKPPAGAKSKALKPPAGQPVAPRAEDLSSQELEFRRRQVQKGQDEEKYAREAANREARCNNAKSDLAIAEQAALFRQEKGERVFLSDAEQKAEIARRRAIVAQNCP